MIEINLLPEGLRKKETVKISLPMPDKKTVMIAVTAFFGVQVLLIGLMLIQRMELTFVKAEAVKLQETGKELSHQKNEIAIMKERMKQIRTLTQRKYYWASLLDAFTHSMTKGVWLRSIVVAEDVAPKKGIAAKAKELTKPAPAKKENKKATAKKPAGKNNKTPEPAPEVAAANTKSLKIEGSVVAPGHETAYIGRFIKSLKENAVINSIFTDVELSGMNQKRIKEYDVYDFTLLAHYKKEKV